MTEYGELFLEGKDENGKEPPNPSMKTVELQQRVEE